MTENEILFLAEKYLTERSSKYVKPGTLGEFNGDQIEVIFLNTLTLEPNVVVCPPDIRVWVNTKTKEVTWAVQM